MEPIKIEKFKNKFTVKSKYDAELLEIIRKIESRYWSAEKLEWSLPIVAFENFISEINKIDDKQKYDIKVVDNKPYAFISKNNDNYELKFASFVDNFSQFKHIPNAEYNKETRKLSIPASQYDNMINLLRENQFDYLQTEEKKEEKKTKPKRSILKNAIL